MRALKIKTVISVYAVNGKKIKVLLMLKSMSKFLLPSLALFA
jgi:hypothetical protein